MKPSNSHARKKNSITFNFGCCCWLLLNLNLNVSFVFCVCWKRHSAHVCHEKSTKSKDWWKKNLKTMIRCSFVCYFVIRNMFHKLMPIAHTYCWPLATLKADEWINWRQMKITYTIRTHIKNRWPNCRCCYSSWIEFSIV